MRAIGDLARAARQGEKGQKMKEMIKKVREDKGGFTLAELLIVVAIILVLVAIAIPVFSGALDNANKSTAQADIRAVKGAASTKYLLDNETDNSVFYTGTVTRDGDVTQVVKASGTPTETTDAQVVAWLKGSDPTFDITVEVVKTAL